MRGTQGFSKMFVMLTELSASKRQVVCMRLSNVTVRARKKYSKKFWLHSSITALFSGGLIATSLYAGQVSQEASSLRNEIGILKLQAGVNRMEVNSLKLQNKELTASLKAGVDELKADMLGVSFIQEVNPKLSDITAYKYYKHIEDRSKVYGVPLDLALAICWQESDFTKDCESSVGATGIMQIMVGTGRGLGVSKEQLKDPYINIDAGLRYLKYLKGLFSSEELAILAYNQGEVRVANGTHRTWYLKDIKEKRVIVRKSIKLID